jgi:hypothetical protein
MVALSQTSQIAALSPQFPNPRDFATKHRKQTLYIVEVTERKQ